MMEIFDSQEWL